MAFTNKAKTRERTQSETVPCSFESASDTTQSLWRAVASTKVERLRSTVKRGVALGTPNLAAALASAPSEIHAARDGNSFHWRITLGLCGYDSIPYKDWVIDVSQKDGADEELVIVTPEFLTTGNALANAAAHDALRANVRDAAADPTFGRQQLAALGQRSVDAWSFRHDRQGIQRLLERWGPLGDTVTRISMTHDTLIAAVGQALGEYADAVVEDGQTDAELVFRSLLFAIACPCRRDGLRARFLVGFPPDYWTEWGYELSAESAADTNGSHVDVALRFSVPDEPADDRMSLAIRQALSARQGFRRVLEALTDSQESQQ